MTCSVSAAAYIKDLQQALAAANARADAAEAKVAKLYEAGAAMNRINEERFNKLRESEEALAAARRALTTIEEILTDCGYTDYAARVEAIKILEALAAPAAASDKDSK
jgi:outer membrane protein assembly factor BamD (BamD/ComL family)